MACFSMGGALRRAAPIMLAVAAGALGSSAAIAQSIDVTGAERLSAETRSVQVALSDLDLDSVEGVALLHRRVRWAARQVCGSNPIRGLDRRLDHARCLTDARSDALAQVGRRTAVAAITVRRTG